MMSWRRCRPRWPSERVCAAAQQAVLGPPQRATPIANAGADGCAAASPHSSLVSG